MKITILLETLTFLRLSLKNEIGVIQKPLAYYRVHENNLSKKLDIYLKKCIIG